MTIGLPPNRWALGALLMSAMGCTILPVSAQDAARAATDAPGQTALATESGDGAAPDQGMRCGGDGHEGHRAMMERKGYDRSLQELHLDDAPLVAMDGQETTLLAEIAGDKPVIVTFIFTTCATICPVLSGTFAELETRLDQAGEDVRLVSISIDPEYDTPERLRDYARRFKAGPEWRFLTGDPAQIDRVRKAFGVYRGNKMSHEPTILIHRSEGQPWVRLAGLASAGDVLGEYRRLEAQP